MNLLTSLSHIVLADSNSGPIDEESIVGKLFPSEGAFWDFIIQLIAMVILFLVIFFFAYKPVRKLLDKRATYVENNIKESELAKEEAKAVLAKKEETIQEGKVTANKIIEEAKGRAAKESEAIILSAKEEAAQIKKRADEDIASAIEKSKQEAREEIIDVALAASSKVLEREVSEKDNKKLIDDYVSSLQKKD